MGASIVVQPGEEFVCFYQGRIPGKHYAKQNIDCRAAAAIVAKYMGDYKPSNFYQLDLDLSDPEQAADFPFGRINRDGVVVFLLGYSFSEKTKYILDELRVLKAKVIWIAALEDLGVENYGMVKDAYGIRAKFVDNYVSTAYYTAMYLMPEKVKEIPTLVQLADAETILRNGVHQDSVIIRNSLLLYRGLLTVPTEPLDPIWRQIFNNYNGSADSVVSNLILRGSIVSDYLDEWKKARVSKGVE